MPKKKTTAKRSAVKEGAKKTPTRTTSTKKKSTSRKSTTRRRTKKTQKKSAKKPKRSQKRVLVCVNGEECFWTTDGQILSSLVDLRDALSEMTEDVFKHHVTRERNDFADWVEQVLEDKTLSESLRRSRKPSSARTVVVRRMKVYDL